jgi:hypothetical protein
MTRRTAAAIALTAVVGLLVSVLTLVSWSREQVEPVGTTGAGLVELPSRPLARPGPAPESPNDAAPERQARRITTAPASLRRKQVGRAAPPVELTIPSVQLRARVRPVGVARDGQMQLPPDPSVLGWYRFGPAPATRTGGSVVLAGHLDSREFGLGPLVRLREVDLGSTISVATRRGKRLDYTVVRVERFDRQQLPPELFGRTGRELLRILTCGGAYDPASGYEQNLVVTATPAA